ncbi:MAG: GMC family oxidoreductase, partial [Hyphomicrobiales bacterium]
YFMQLRSPDDPWDALKRLIKRQSDRPLQDLRAVVAGTGLLARGVGTKLLNDRAMPTALKEFVVAAAIRYNPNLVADEFQSRGIPHKLTGVRIDAIAEQRPDPNSRVTLSARTDRLGVPIATIDWRINDEDRRTIVRLAHLTRDAFVAAGLPSPVLEPWVAEDRPWDAVIIDMAHTVGTTRMSDDPRTGVVDKTCQVHGVSGLYVAGASVFPTSGHANPTLMIVALAIRLADTIKRTIERGPITAAAPISNEMDAV